MGIMSIKTGGHVIDTRNGRVGRIKSLDRETGMVTYLERDSGEEFRCDLAYLETLEGLKTLNGRLRNLG